MLENYSPYESVIHEDRTQNFDLSYIIDVVKRRILYFVIPFLLIVSVGFAIIKSLPHIYHSEGEILVEAPGIAPDLVHPTITEVAVERFEVFKQRMMASDTLMPLVKKFNLFPNDRRSMSELQLLDLVRKRVLVKPVTLEIQSNSPTIAFSVGFDYEVPEVALGVASELVTDIMNEDAKRRANNATETTKLLQEEVKRLTSEHDAVVAQIEILKQRRPDQQQADSEEAKAQLKSLADLQSELVQKSSVYSDEHPVVKKLKKEIAALKRVIAAGPRATSVIDKSDKPDTATAVLDQQRLNIEKNLDDASRKLAAARLGEAVERNQQAEHLQVIQYPELPYNPVRPKKLRLFAIVLGIAMAVGGGAALAAEMLDGSIRRSQELAAVVDRHLIVSIPYLSTPEEERRKRRHVFLLCTALVIVLAAAITGALIRYVPIDFGWLFPH